MCARYNTALFGTGTPASSVVNSTAVVVVAAIFFELRKVMACLKQSFFHALNYYYFPPLVKARYIEFGPLLQQAIHPLNVLRYYKQIGSLGNDNSIMHTGLTNKHSKTSKKQHGKGKTKR